ncbi:MAG: acetamidase, partial [Burkholderiaceae bacterium]
MIIRQSMMGLLLWVVGSATAMPLQPLADQPGKLAVPGTRGKVWYVPSTLNTIKWGYLPNVLDAPVLRVPSGATVVFDTLSHEGLLEDQGRDASKYFSSKGVAEKMVLKDAVAITRSSLPHDFAKDGPHIVTGPIAIDGAQPGDVLKVDILAVTPRVPYGVISNRHGKGALPGEMPEGPPPEPDASAAQPEKYRNVSVFTPIRKDKYGRWMGVLKNSRGEDVTFATA